MHKYLRSLKKSKKHSIMVLVLVTLGLTIGLKLLSTRNTYAAWATGYAAWANRITLNVVNNSGQTLHTNSTYTVTVNTKVLGSEVQADCDDLRVVYQPDASTSTELPRYYVINGSATNCSDSSATALYFPLQADITNGSTSGFYYLYYNNPDATAPSNANSAFNIGSKTATFVTLFNQTKNTIDGEAPTVTVTDARYYGSKSALNLDGFNDYGTKTDAASLSITADLTLEAWVKLDKVSAEQTIAAKWDETTASNDRSYRLYVTSGNAFAFSVSTDGTAVTTVTGTTTTATLNTWYHIAGVYDNAGTLDIYVNGVKDATQVTGGPTSLDDNASSFYVGAKLNTSGAADTFFTGVIDEVRLSNTIRYTDTFSTSTAPFERDTNTAALLHFDESFTSPYNSGAATDDSDNANNLTLTGAKYLSGNVGYDARTGYVETQPMAAKNTGIWMEQPRTNHLSNPSFDHATYNTGWNAPGANLTSAENTTYPYYKFGSKSLSLSANSTAIAGASNSMTITTSSLVAGDYYGLSFFVYNNTAGSVGGTIDATVIKPVFNNTVQSASITYTDVGGGWWRVFYSAVQSGTLNYGFEVQPSRAVYIDGVQLENVDNYGASLGGPSTYIDGSLGTGFSWVGTAHASKSARTGGSIEYTDTNNLNPNVGSVSFWTVRPSAHNGISYFRWPVAGGSNQYAFGCDGTSCNFQKTVSAANQNLIGTLGADGWHHIVLTWSNTTGTELFVDAVSQGTNPNTSVPSGLAGTGWGMGSSDTTYAPSGIVSDWRAYDSVLTTTETQDLYYMGLMSHSGTTYETQQAVNYPSAPIAQWHMDEGNGTTLYDASPAGKNNLTASNVAWNTTGANTNSARAVYATFNGTSSYASRSYDPDFDFGTGSFSITGWFKHPTTIAGQDTLLARYGTSAGYKLYMDSSGYICFAIDDDSSWGPDDSACSTTSYADNTWHHFAAVKDSTTSITLYIDKVPIATDVSIGSGTMTNTNTTLYLGVDSTGNSNYWAGDIDGVVIVDSAYTAAEVNSSYLNVKSSASFGSNPTDVLTNGLLGYWKLDETSSTAADSSGNGLTLTNNGIVTYVPSVYGNGSEHVPASTQYLSTATTINGVKTVSFWTNPDATTNYFVSLTSGAYITAASGTLAATGFSNPTIYVNGVVSTTLTVDVWQLVTVTTDTAINANQFYVGRQGDNYYDGTLDDVRLYSTPLAQADIAILYKWAPGPISYWKLDEGSGATAADFGANTNTATLSGSTWTDGKFGKALNYNSSTATTTVADHASLDITVGTVAFWTYLSPTPADTASTQTIDLTTDNDDSQLNTSDFFQNGEDNGGSAYMGAQGTNEYWGFFRFPLTDTILSTADVTNATLRVRGFDTFQWLGDSYLSMFVTDSTNCSTVTTVAERPDVSGGSTNVYPATLGGGTRWPASGGLTWSTSADNTSVNFSDSLDYLLTQGNLTAGNYVCIWVAAPDGNSAQVGFRESAFGSLYPRLVITSEANGGNGVLVGKGRDAYQLEVDNSFNITGYVNTTNTVTTASSAGWHHIAMTHDGATQRLYVDGALKDTTAYAGTIGINATDLLIGQAIKASLDDVKIYNYARSPQQIVEDMNAGHPAGGSPVASQTAYWKFDEQSGQTVNTSANAYTAVRGTTSGAEATDPGWYEKSNCKINGCLNFDGTDDVVTVTNSDNIDFDVGLSAEFTMAAWIYPDGAGEGTGGRIFYKGTNTWLRVDTLSSGLLDIEASLDLGTTDATINAAAKVTQSVWNHVALSYTDDGDDEITLWVNGKVVGTSTNGVGSPASGDTNDLLIGGDSSNTFDGRIDEAKIYAFELSAATLAIDMNAGTVASMGNVIGTKDFEGYSGNPPLAWWKYDENTGTTPADTSGNDNNQTFGASTAAPKWVTRDSGGALQFDGSNDYAYSTSTIDLSTETILTVEFWLNWDAYVDDDDLAMEFSPNINSNAGGFIVDPNWSNSDFAVWHSNSTGGVSGAAFTRPSAGVWHHYAIIFDKTAASATDTIPYVDGVPVSFTKAYTATMDNTFQNTTLYIMSRAGANLFGAGKIDDIKIYDYARTRAQIAYDYNRGAPTVWYRTDECTGTTIYNAAKNSSGQAAGINGTLTLGANDQTSAGDCTTNANTAWYNGRVGRYTSSLNYDGNDDVLTTTNTSAIDLNTNLVDGFTIAAWIYADTAGEGSGGQIVNKGTDTYLRVDNLTGSTLDIEGKLDLDTTDANLNIASAITTGTWNHIALKYDGSATITVYVNGVNKGSHTGSGETAAESSDLLIGGPTTDNFDGKIDDVRIYNYAMSDNQLKIVYNEGSAVRYGTGN